MSETKVKSIRIPADVLEAIEAEADRRRMKVNRWIVQKLIQALPKEAREGLPKPGELPGPGPRQTE